MEPNMWGPIYWAFLFSTVLGYPLEPGIDIQCLIGDFSVY